MSTHAVSAPPKVNIAWGPIIWMAFLHTGALLAFVPGFFTWSGLVICLVLHWLTGGIGICMTYHRLLTHSSFKVHPGWLKYVLTAIGCCASEGGPIGWVADHRKHHAYSDEPDDVHTPKVSFGWAHMFWWMTPDVTCDHTPEYYKRWAPDLYKDRGLRFIDNTHLVYPLALGASLYFAGQYYGGIGLSWVVWGFFARTVLVLHSTWLVNSATHVWGYRTHETRDDSRNLWWVAIVTYGEGWHNNHHAFQTSAAHGLDWWEIDTTYIAIKLMSYVGLASDVKVAKPEKNSARATTGVSASSISQATKQAIATPSDSISTTQNVTGSPTIESNTEMLTTSTTA